MSNIDYESLLLAQLQNDKQDNTQDNTQDNKQDNNQDYADSTQLRPEDNQSDTQENTQGDANQVSSENNRVRSAEDILNNINNYPSTPSDELKALKTRPKQYKKTQPENCYIKDFPRALMQKVRSLFPDATNNNDALSAFVITHLREDITVSDTVDALVENFNKNDPIVGVHERLRNLETQVSALVKGLSEIELGLSYIIYDRLGYRNVQPKDARSTDMLESNRAGSVTDIVSRLREQATQMRRQDNIKNGRPIR